MKLKKTPEDGKNSKFHELVELMLRKWLYYWKSSIDSIQLSSKYILHRIEKKIILKLIWKHKRSGITNDTNPKSNARSITILDFKLWDKAIEIKTEWYWHKNNRTELMSRNKSTQLYPFDSQQRGTKNIYWKKRPLLKYCWKSCIHM
jgi:hypothetical protein